MSVTTSYYRDTYKGTFGGTDDELEPLLARATDVVDNAIYLSGETVDGLPETDFRTDRTYKAVCAQADFIDNSGGIAAMSEISSESVSLGKFSYSGGEKTAKSSFALCDMAAMYLNPTGLLYKGADVF